MILVASLFLLCTVSLHRFTSFCLFVCVLPRIKYTLVSSKYYHIVMEHIKLEESDIIKEEQYDDEMYSSVGQNDRFHHHHNHSDLIIQSNNSDTGNDLMESMTDYSDTMSKSSSSKRIRKYKSKNPSVQKVDIKAKLERSRQSARECRARKKLRYQYLEDLVLKRENANLVLKKELENFKEITKMFSEGRNRNEIDKRLNKQI